MRLITRLWMILAVVTGGFTAPTPLPAAPKTEDNLVEEDGFLVLVPTLKAEDAEKNGQDLKREVEYELITIPKELLRREIRQVAQSYSQPSKSSSSGGGFIIGGDSGENNNNVIYTSSSNNLGGLGQISGLVNGLGTTLNTLGQGVNSILSSVVPAASAGGTHAASWLAENKADGIRGAARVASDGLRYAGQLSAAVLRVLLQVPAIKARVLSEVIRASQPLTYAISDVLAESADDLGVFFDAKNEVLADVLEIFIRLVQDILRVNGRIIAKFGASGLDIGAAAFNAGIRVGGAFVESAGGIATALGTGVGDLIRVGTSADFPPPPNIPLHNLFSLFPTLDLTRLFAPPTTTSTDTYTLAPLPLPSSPPVTPAPTQTYSYQPPTSQPNNIYSLPGR